MENKMLVRHKIATITISTVLTVGLVVIAGQYIKIGHTTLNQALLYSARQINNRIAPTPATSILTGDESLGWKNKTSASCREYKPLGYNVVYNTDERGNRITSGGYHQPEVLFVGCSFTFGDGVADGETYPAQLSADIPGYKMVDSGVSGYGTYQAMKKMEQVLDQPAHQVKMVVYGFIQHHLHRNYWRKKWMGVLAASHRDPLFYETEAGKLVIDAFLKTEVQGNTDTVNLAARELEITAQCISNMWKWCEAEAIPFLLVFIPGGTVGNCEQVLATLDTRQILDLRPKIAFSTIDNGVDAHPTAAGYRQIAHYLLPEIQSRLGLNKGKR